MRIILFGDGPWAARCVERLREDGHAVLAVVVRRRPTDDSLASLAHALDLPLRQPERVNAPELVAWVRELAPDLNVSVSYDQILRQPMRESARHGFINCHAGKLPFYRGRSVIHWALINNERQIGLTIHHVDGGIDSGDIIMQETLPIGLEDTFATVAQCVAQAFPDLLARAVALLERGEATRRAQAHLPGTYFPARRPGDEWIDWAETSLNIYNKIRAITRPGPGARTLLGDRVLIVWRACYDPDAPRYIATAGEVVGVVPDQGVRVKTGDTTLLLQGVQFEGAAETEHIPAFPIGTRFGLNLLQAVQDLRRDVAELRRLLAGSSGTPLAESLVQGRRPGPEDR